MSMKTTCFAKCIRSTTPLETESLEWRNFYPHMRFLSTFYLLEDRIMTLELFKINVCKRVQQAGFHKKKNRQVRGIMVYERFWILIEFPFIKK